jgi:phosphoribosylformimino-5-aminoimidazole carboxamide ribotide isomerase
MILYPALDLKNGQCVRLLRGAMDEATVYNDNPLHQAHEFIGQGAQWLHVVDLDGAVTGHPVNGAVVRGMVAECRVPIQLGGGIRTMDTIHAWLDMGVSRVILGTVALKNPALVFEACKAYPNQIAVGIDARDGFVATEGWYETSTVTAIDLARKLEDAGVAALIYTDIARDGTKGGVNILTTADLAEAVRIPVIASGGVGSLEDVRKVLAHKDSGIEGLIIGRALYDKAFSLDEALAVVRGQAQG